MNFAEFQVYVQTSAMYVHPQDLANPVKKPGSELTYQIRLSELLQDDAVSPTNWYAFEWFNRGISPGPQVYAADELEKDPDTGLPLDPPVVLHAAGDPKLDDDGNQIVISEWDAERIHYHRPIRLPVGHALTAVGYMDSLIDAGTFSAWKYTGGEPPDWFNFTAATDNGDGTESWKNYRAEYDAQGNPSYVEVV